MLGIGNFHQDPIYRCNRWWTWHNVSVQGCFISNRRDYSIWLYRITIGIGTFQTKSVKILFDFKWLPTRRYGRNGTLKIVKAINPSVKTTGWNDKVFENCNCVDAFLQKPIMIPDLIDAVEIQISTRQREHELGTRVVFFNSLLKA